MYLFSVSGTKQNGMDDVNVNGLSSTAPIEAYKKYFKEKIYDFLSTKGKKFHITFKIKDITQCYGGGYKIWCEIIELDYSGERIVNNSTMNYILSCVSRTISTDLELCSIHNRDVVIMNKEHFMEREMMVGYKNHYITYEKSLMSGYKGFSPIEEEPTTYKLWKTW